MSLQEIAARAKAIVDRARARIAGRLGWKAAFRTFSYVQSALWVVPIAAVFLALVFIRLLELRNRFVSSDLTGIGIALHLPLRVDEKADGRGHALGHGGGVAETGPD